MTSLILQSSCALAAGFYGSIVSYACFRTPHHNNNNSNQQQQQQQHLTENKVIAYGFILCAPLGSSLLASSTFMNFLASSPSIFGTTGAITMFEVHAFCAGFHFWFLLLWGSWLVRDRARGMSLDQVYLEAVTDGILVLNIPQKEDLF